MITRRLGNLVLILTAVTAVLAPVAGCGGDPPSPPEVPATVTVAPAPVAPQPGTAPAGEIWQYALGKSWDDPAIAAYTQDFGRHDGEGDDPTGHVRSQGFALDLDAAGVVTSVTLFNDEAMLGYGAGYQAFEGALPLDLGWEETAADVYARLGDPAAVTGGAGLDVGWTYRTSEGATLVVSFRAGDQFGTEVSADAPLHSVEVSGP